MSDLISRQAAIALCDWYEHEYSEVENYFQRFKEELKELPSAQDPEIIRCKDCRYYQDNNNGYPHMDCKWNADETPDGDDFCSGAERRSDE